MKANKELLLAIRDETGALISVVAQNSDGRDNVFYHTSKMNQDAIVNLLTQSYDMKPIEVPSVS